MTSFSFGCKSLALLGAFAASVLTQQSAFAARTDSHPTGRQAVASVRHDWKKSSSKTVHLKQVDRMPLPAHFGRLSPEARLAYLHDRRNLNPNRFDRYHPALGRLLALDDRLRAAQSQDCRTMNGILPNNALTRYLDYRRSLNPTRFDIYHPALGAILVEDQKLKSGQGCVLGQIIPPPSVIPPSGGTPSPGPPSGGGPLPGRLVPEPSSFLLMAIGGTGALGVAILRRRPKPQQIEA